MPHKIKGVYAAVATPLDEDGACDATRLVAHCSALLDQGCHGLGLLGSTGEANSFSVAERMAVLDTVIAGGIAPDTILLGTGAAAISDAIALTRHGIASGVTDMLVLPPFYYKNVTEDGVVDYYRRLIEAVAAPGLRVTLYHIPQFSGVPMTRGVIDRLIELFPGSIVGVKDSSGDIESARGLVRHHPELGLMVGSDQHLVPMLREGGAGCITGLANIIAADLRLIYDHHADPKAAALITTTQERLERLRALSAALPAIASTKAMIADRVSDRAWCRTRPPLAPLGPADLTRIHNELAQVFAA